VVWWIGVSVSELLPLSVGYLDMGPFYRTTHGVIPEDYNLDSS